MGIWKYLSWKKVLGWYVENLRVYFLWPYKATYIKYYPHIFYIWIIIFFRNIARGHKFPKWMKNNAHLHNVFHPTFHFPSFYVCIVTKFNQPENDMIVRWRYHWKITFFFSSRYISLSYHSFGWQMMLRDMSAIELYNP